MGYFSDRRKLKEARTALAIAQAEHEAAVHRNRATLMDLQRENALRFTNTGYSHGGASTSQSWAKGYDAESLSPKSDIEENRKTLRERSRDLVMNAPIATAAVNSVRTNCVGGGLEPKPKIDYGFLGITVDEAVRLQGQIKKEFSLWANSTECDSADLNNFYELQQIVFTDWLKNGEEFALVRYGEPSDRMPYSLRIKLVLADRVCTPGSLDSGYDGCDRRLPNGNVIMNGVEIDPDGRVEAYHICSEFPGEYNASIPKWTRVEKRGRRTGNPNILHIFNAESAEQYRGVPFLAPVIKSLKQLTRYTEAEIMAAIINAMFALFVKTENAEPIDGFGGVEDDGDEAHAKDDEIRLGSGTINYLKPGEDIKPVESSHPNGSYESFLSAFTSMIGAALEIAPEVLMKKFGQSFSASKGALNETWRSFSMRRKWFVNDFCRQVYELWFAEAVSLGRINAPGFFTDPLIRQAYTNATWTGPAQGCLNPQQEANAAVTRIGNGLSTHEDECAAINGSDFEDNVRTLINENGRLHAANSIFEEEDT